ncbi:polysaccharide biosynthesis protein [Alteriqipengyuania lutimaris]|uniref:Polysaccharide biosynthesis protein n=1 Tax=Alteriqipengyuania lutimaris TaxID=1538146 RepID=A0A395LJ05_9SPHN|nr:nucleoside-diphosphate sugar epimerase/dehydratase [Alteriqipengyuania lutimaris]MBB3034387.1 FlaA1/EpsC-like NDP-sugar epimerase [Alteriqipengyuania lutimaris]RDS76711.1 polysaccharide biosynthesis protein [Alteriqipengyuania lutimaris]
MQQSREGIPVLDAWALRLLGASRAFASVVVRADRKVKRMVVAATDLVLLAVAVIISFSLRLGYWDLFSQPIVTVLAIEAALFLAIFPAGGIYSNLFRFLGSRGMSQLALASIGLAIPSVIIIGFYAPPGVPRTVGAIFPLVFFLLVTLSRVVARYILIDLLGERSELRRVIVFGAGDEGRQLAASIRRERAYKLVGLLDDDPGLAASRLDGIPIFGTDMLQEVIDRLGVDIVFLAEPGLSRVQKTALIDKLRSRAVRVLTLPAISEIVDGSVSVSDLREVDVTELLSRDPVAPDCELLAQSIRDKVVLVTGAGGTIGGELARQIVKQKPRRLVLLDMSEAALYQIDGEIRHILADGDHGDIDIVPELASVEKKLAVRRIFERFRPDTVYHAAAYKHVPMVEANVISGVKNNVRGTLNVALVARETGVGRVTLISTDKAVRPTNVMGASKRVCEMIFQAFAADTRGQTVFSMVRFGNVLGSSGSVVPHFRQQIETGGPVSVTHRDITRYFMTIPEAAELVIQAGAMAKGGEVYLLDMGEPVKIMDLAKTMILLSGRTLRDADNPDGDIEIVETGLRPGEKLYEELLIDGHAEPTRNPRIFRAEEGFIPWEKLERDLTELEQYGDDGKDMLVRRKLAQLVLGYRNRADQGMVANL